MGLWGLGRKAAFVLVDQAKSTKIALFDTGIGSIKVDVFLVTQVDCSVSGSSEMPNDPEKALEMLKKKQEILQKELERLKNRK